jgi:hypothetical protein
MSRSSWFLSFGLFACIGCSAEVHHPANPTLRVVLFTETPFIAPGTNPHFVAHLVNDGAEPVTIVLPGDGSESAMRTPIVRWSPPMQLGGRCGNVNALKAEEVVTLQAGASVPLTGWIGLPSLKDPGKHHVSLELENIPDLEWRGLPLGRHNATAMDRVRRTPRFKAVSNVVEVQVQE